ncbi:MAG: hypothetical protein FJ109_05600 [Deltaproteobacteria bacterium]|nr:hypothetical protein [Deltaproteobacteria bacterium]
MGCFLDPCTKNSQCESGWCVEHLGEGVCTVECQEECPDGWDCKQVASTGPDVAWVCVSLFSNLCKPCATAADCESPGGLEDACLDYGKEGAFCGGPCQTGNDCPTGFACTSVKTVDGVMVDQCVSENGSCPCTGKSVALGLWTPCDAVNEWGTCTGKRVCGEGGLTPCDAPAPALEICNGVDDDCDGAVDEPDAIGGSYVNLCDDGNGCTSDACKGADGCDHALLDAGECMDGDACTVGDHCENGVCVGLPVVCDDANPCTDDQCDGLGGCSSTYNAAPCDDKDPCTVADGCESGQCIGVAINCDCKADSDCVPFEDGDVCNGKLFCDTSAIPYECALVPGSQVKCPPSQGIDALCQSAFCDPVSGACSFVPAHEGFACSDSNACTVGDTCVQGKCQPGVSMICSDGNPCTDDSCNPQAGCVFTSNNAPCSDNNACTTGDTCKDGACVPTGATICDDSNPCTTDSCIPGGGCLYKLNELPCDDGNVCTTADHCHLGGCIGGSSLVCNDSNVCTDDTCDPLVGCKFKPNSSPCDDGNACTLGDVCGGGWCKGTSILTCDDNNPCTTNSCQVGVGCVFTNNVLPCDDGNACTQQDKCSGGACLAGTPIDCGDGDACTTDSCDPAKGCLHAFNTNPCDDGNACTLQDACAAGVCKGGPALVCSDNKPCTQDQCDPAKGCVYPPIVPCCGNGVVEAGEACDDGNNLNGDGCSAACASEASGCVTMGVDVRTLQQPPEKWQQSSCQTLCENTPTVIPAGWHIATAAEVAHLTKKLSFGSCAAYGICGSYWFGSGNLLTAGCSALNYTCPTGGCTAHTTHCYTQVMLIKDGKDGTCTTN